MRSHYFMPLLATISLSIFTVALAGPDEKRESFQIEIAGKTEPTLKNLSKKTPAKKIVTLAESLAPLNSGQTLVPFNQNCLLRVWSSSREAAFGLYKLRNGQLIETSFGEWPQGWYPRGFDDFNGDKLTDFLLVKTTGQGNSRKYYHRVAVQTKTGLFQFSKIPLKAFVTGARGCHYSLADMNKDGRKDLLFHSFAHGGSYRATIFMKAGLGKGEFGPAKRLISTSVAATSIVAGDFNGDGLNDLYLPPDDDVSDDGQSYLVFNLGAGRFSKAKESIDFLPKKEGFGADSFTAYAQALDFDQDGKLDLLVRKIEIGQSAEWSIYHGNGKGAFPKETVLKKVKWGQSASFFFLHQKATLKAVKRIELELSKKDFLKHWVQLGNSRVKSAAQSLRLLRNAGDTSIQSIVEKLTEKGPDKNAIHALIEELNEDSIQRRNRATKTLASYGDLITTELKQALKNSRSVEVRWRLRVLLNELEKAKKSQNTAISRRNYRAIRLLEGLNSTKSRAALKTLSNSASYGMVRELAERALKRFPSR